jgi:signal transduction histidine kinase
MRRKSEESNNADLRQRAEKILITKEKKPSSRLFLADALKLIHELEVHQIELEMQKEELIRSNEEKDKFFSIIAHDLRGPFNIFLGYTQLLSEELPNLSMDEIVDMIHRMKFSATNLFQLLEDLLDWSCMLKDLEIFKPSQFLLFPRVMESIVLVTEAARIKGIEIKTQIPQDLLIYADRNMLGCILFNLTFNSVKFSTKGARIKISACLVPNNFVEISVSDTGIGMNNAILENLFLLNSRISRQGTEGEPSTGLGLILCKGYIEKHKGKIWAESQEGVGSTFRFILPYNSRKLSND